jgi:peptidoglycan/xylan/chitin deacetylase (PgdA/CDA1 family)
MGGALLDSVLPVVLSAALAAAGHDSAVGQCGMTEGAFLNGPRALKKVALTFDLCPTSSHPGFSSRLYQTLVDAHVPATFFVTGSWAGSHAAALRQLAAVPFFDIGMHGLQHLALEHEAEPSIRHQIEGDRQRLRALGVRPVRLFRPPYGSTSETVARVAQGLGVRIVLWDVVSGDADKHVGSEAIDREVLRRVRPGSIVIMHANHEGAAVEASLPVVLHELQTRGFTFVTVREILAGCRVPSGKGT